MGRMLSENATSSSTAAPSSVFRAAISALRMKQWTKNALVLAAIIFSGHFTNPEDWVNVGIAFASFCCVSSAGYIINDIRDREADAKHPRKSKRPIASGRLSVGTARIEAVALCLIGGAAAFLVSPPFVAIVVAYFATTMSYSLYFKDLVILDVMLIATGFIWRAVAGAVAIDVAISPWLLICTAFLALFLGFNKRRAELNLLQGDAGAHRKNLTQYSPAMLDQFQGITTSGAIISYALYTVNGPTPWLMLTMPYVLFGIFRYIYLVDQQGAGGAPDETLLRDRPILATCALYALTAVIVLRLVGDGAF